MRMEQDGVEIYILPDSAKCCMDEKERSPLDMEEECPMGYEKCSGDCEYYTE